jgi:hypothetical protein
MFAPYFEHIAGQEEIAVSVYLARRLLRPVPPGIFRR